MPKQVIVWECEYCKKKRSPSRKWIEKHEKQCMANPDGKNCFKCKHLTERDNSFDAYAFGNACEESCPYKTDRNSYTALTCEHYEVK